MGTTMGTKCPSLQSIILKSIGQESFHSSIRDYFRFRRLNGYSAVTKPVLNGVVVLILQTKLSAVNDLSQCRYHALYVVECLLEFSSNSTEQLPWQNHYEALADLINCCLDIFVNVKYMDLQQKTRNFDLRCYNSLSKLFEVVDFAAEQSEELCNRLLKKGARKLFLMLRHLATGLHDDIHLSSQLLIALSSLCFRASELCVHEALKEHQSHVDLIGTGILKYDLECQLSAYIILSKSLANIKEAKLKAAKWFKDFPSLQEKFLFCFGRSITEGSGKFLNKISELNLK